MHIERLILDGIAVEPGQLAPLQAAVEAELTRLLGDNTLAARLLVGGAVATLRAAPIQLAPHGSPAHLGAQIAQAVAGSISR
jgi:hypothetical protein